MKSKGFTLIELLVVISIIGLLASLIMLGFTNARLAARDAKRVADLDGIIKAAELYYLEEGYYPESSNPPNLTNSTTAEWLTTLQAAFAPYTILPVDPVNDMSNYGSPRSYVYISDPTTDFCVTGITKKMYIRRGYYLFTWLEHNQQRAIDDGGINTGYYERYGGDIEVVPGSCP